MKKKTIDAAGSFRILIAFMLLLVFMTQDAEGARRSKKKTEGSSEEAKMEYKAHDMLNRGMELIAQKQEERGLKMVQSIAQMFPKSKTKFKAFIALGTYYTGKRNYEAGVKQFLMAEKTEDDAIKAEAMYRGGICYYNLNRFDKAFVILRKVTNEYPWSIFANESYYYIGLCHFKLNRWSRAVEALEMVGTSVSLDFKESIPAEAGQRLFLKINDEDLIVLLGTEEKFKVDLQVGSGDKEKVDMELLGKSGVNYIGSIQTKPGEAVPGDGLLQCIGNDTVKVLYSDRNTQSGKRNQTLISTVKMVSSATVGFTDGAYREYTKGVFGGQDFFVRVKDLDRDISNERDTLTVSIATMYVLEKEIDVEKRGILLDEEEEILERDRMELTLTETEAHSGVFAGTAFMNLALKKDEIKPDDSALWSMQGDEAVLEYEDETNIMGEAERLASYEAKVLAGEIQDVKIEHREVESLELKAKKELIESKIFLKLGEIFKDVGLNKQASLKAEEGLERVNAVVKIGLRSSLDREIIEEAFNVKWDLFMVQGKLNSAINTCNALIRLYPDSTRVDRALLKVAQARIMEGDMREAIRIYNGILRLPHSDRKAEAQFRIAESKEQDILERSKTSTREPDFSPAMLEYKKVLDNYPDSMFAGEALDKISNYYMRTKDYRRAIELMEQVFQDYPDASFLDIMLYKWALAAYRLGELQLAKEKCEQLMNEYPDSKVAVKAKKMNAILDKKLGD